MSDKKFTATLIRGNCFFLGNKRFDAGKPKEVTVEERDYLEEHGVDHFTSAGESFTKPKFEFEEVSEDGEDGGSTTSKSTRTRKQSK